MTIGTRAVPFLGDSSMEELEEATPLQLKAILEEAKTKDQLDRFCDLYRFHYENNNSPTREYYLEKFGKLMDRANKRLKFILFIKCTRSIPHQLPEEPTVEEAFGVEEKEESPDSESIPSFLFEEKEVSKTGVTSIYLAVDEENDDSTNDMRFSFTEIAKTELHDFDRKNGIRWGEFFTIALNSPRNIFDRGKKFKVRSRNPRYTDSESLLWHIFDKFFEENIHDLISERGYWPDSWSGASIACMLAIFSVFNTAHQMFFEMLQRDCIDFVRNFFPNHQLPSQNYSRPCFTNPGEVFDRGKHIHPLIWEFLFGNCVPQFVLPNRAVRSVRNSVCWFPSFNFSYSVFGRAKEVTSTNSNFYSTGDYAFCMGTITSPSSVLLVCSILLVDHSRNRNSVHHDEYFFCFPYILGGTHGTSWHCRHNGLFVRKLFSEESSHICVKIFRLVSTHECELLFMNSSTMVLVKGGNSSASCSQRMEVMQQNNATVCSDDYGTVKIEMTERQRDILLVYILPIPTVVSCHLAVYGKPPTQETIALLVRHFNRGCLHTSYTAWVLSLGCNLLMDLCTSNSPQSGKVCYQFLRSECLLLFLGYAHTIFDRGKLVGEIMHSTWSLYFMLYDAQYVNSGYNQAVVIYTFHFSLFLLLYYTKWWSLVCQTMENGSWKHFLAKDSIVDHLGVVLWACTLLGDYLKWKFKWLATDLGKVQTLYGAHFYCLLIRILDTVVIHRYSAEGSTLDIHFFVSFFLSSSCLPTVNASNSTPEQFLKSTWSWGLFGLNELHAFYSYLCGLDVLAKKYSRRTRTRHIDIADASSGGVRNASWRMRFISIVCLDAIWNYATSFVRAGAEFILTHVEGFWYRPLKQHSCIEIIIWVMGVHLTTAGASTLITLHVIVTLRWNFAVNAVANLDCALAGIPSLEHLMVSSWSTAKSSIYYQTLKDNNFVEKLPPLSVCTLNNGDVRNVLMCTYQDGNEEKKFSSQDISEAIVAAYKLSIWKDKGILIVGPGFKMFKGLTGSLPGILATWIFRIHKNYSSFANYFGPLYSVFAFFCQLVYLILIHEDKDHFKGSGMSCTWLGRVYPISSRLALVQIVGLALSIFTFMSCRAIYALESVIVRVC